MWYTSDSDHNARPDLVTHGPSLRRRPHWNREHAKPWGAGFALVASRAHGGAGAGAETGIDRPPSGGPLRMLVQRWPRRHDLHGWRGRLAQRRGPGGESRHEHLRRGRPEAERGVRAYAVVVAPPAFDNHLGLPKRVEDLALQQFVAQAGVERLHVPVLPRAA